MRSVPPQRQKAGDITGEVLMRNVVLVLLVGLILSVGVASAADPYGNDLYRIIHVNSSVDGALSDFQVGNGSESFVIEYDSDMQPDFDDIRMYYDSNMTEISYFYNGVVDSTSAYGRMKLNVPASGGVDVRMYYGDGDLISSGNSFAVYNFYDNYSGTTINVSKWDETDTGSDYITQNDTLLFSGGASSWGTVGISSDNTFSRPFVYETKWRSSSTSYTRSFGIKDTTSGVSYDNFVYAFHADPVSVFKLIENGSIVDDTATYAANTDYWLRVEVLETGAKYYRSTDNINWTLLYTSSYSIESPLKIGATTYHGPQEFDDTLIREYTPNPPTITIGAEQLDVLTPDINTTLTSPINNIYTQHNNFTFNITGNFTSANATLFIDSSERWNGSVSIGSNTAHNITLTEGMHSWYINATATAAGNTTYNQSSNASFYYDISNPTIPTVQINPDYATISDGTIVNINLSWADNLQLKNGTFYIDTGSGYSEDSNTTLSGTSDWFNTSINTSGMVGNVITWKQDVYDQAGNNYTYSDSFYVALPSLLIYVYDESTGESVLPSDVTVYNEDVSRSATINGSTNISTLDYGNFTTGKYIVRVSADGYYTRRSIALIDIETISSLNVYLPDVNETVIFDQFILTDNTLLYELSNCIIKLDKPLPNGTDTVFSSYFDFDGVASTYLIATDQYILYIETPDSVISYGWLTPDADGQIEIVITDPIEDLLDDWLSYSLTKSDAGSISLSYVSEVDIGTAVFYVNTTEGATMYTASISANSGSFTYAADVNESYWVSFTVDNVDGDVKTITRLIFWNEEGVQPVRMPLLPDGAPDWFYNLLSVGTVLIVILLFSQIRADTACVIGAAFSGLFWYWGWMKVSGIVIAVAALIAIAAIMYKSRREGI